MLERQRTKLEERNLQICNLWLKNNLTLKELGNRFGLDVKTIRSVIQTAGLETRDKSTARSKKLSDKKPVSLTHAQIGHSINHFRLTVARLNATDFSIQANMSPWRLRAIEMGVVDPTLTELMKLSVLLKIPVAELVRLKNGVTCGQS
jgi:hypothetical protein